MSPMFRRSPSYAVTTFALVFIAVAAFGVRYAARFLPERQPNDLKSEYGEYVRRSMRETVRWHAFGSEAFMQAEERGKIVFLDVGTVMSLSAKRFSEDYATDGEYRRLLHDHFEPIKVDALEMPWLVEALSIEGDSILGMRVSFLGAERFFAVTMDPKGGIVELTSLKPKNGDESLAAWLEGLARLRYADLGEIARRANASREKRPEVAMEALQRGPCDADTIESWTRLWGQAVSSGVFASRRLPVTTLPMEALVGTDADTAIGALSMMLDLALSPCFDPIDGGFFAFSEDPQWRTPIASKLTGHSLQLAAGFAEVGEKHDIALFREIAIRTAQWARNRLRGSVYEAGLGTDQGLDDYSPYYRLDASDVEPHAIRDGNNGFPRIEALQGFAPNVGARRTAQVFGSLGQLKALRAHRTKPRPDRGQYADQNGQSISGLFRIGKALGDKATAEAAARAYRAAIDMYVQPLGDVLHAPTGTGRTTGYCGDSVWLARAALDGFLATGEQRYLNDAERITERMLELFRGEQGALMAYLPSLLQEAGFGLEVYRIEDGDVPSANAVAALNLADLHALTGNAKHRRDAEGIIRAFSGKFNGTIPPAGVVLAGQRLYGNPVNRPSTR